MLARTEVEAELASLEQQVRALELADSAERQPGNAISSVECLPLRIRQLKSALEDRLAADPLTACGQMTWQD